MWQFLLAAAVAGSSYFAQRMFWNGNPEMAEKSEQQDNDVVKAEEEVVHVDPEKPPVPPPLFVSSSVISSGFCRFSDSLNCEVRSSKTGEGSIFRFSSLGDEGGIESSYGSKGSLKAGDGYDAWKRNDGVRRRLGSKKYEKSASTGRYGGVVEESRKKGKRYFLCLKRRRTNKNATGRCEPCSSTGSTLFSWGLGVGIMYMVSAGKSEINKLNTTVHETAKVVQELQNELNQKKSYRDAQNASCKSKIDSTPRNISCMHKQQVVSNSDAEQEDSNYPKDLGLQVTDDVDCVSSVLTEEPEPEALKMDQLEAELESELQKIPWCVAEEASSYEGNFINLGKLEPEHSVNIMNTELLADRLSGPHNPEGIYFDSHQSHGVLPSELDQKLCHLLIEQQESQILVLETKLQSSQSKLHEKETELQALKDCVRHLTELSLETVSGMMKLRRLKHRPLEETGTIVPTHHYLQSCLVMVLTIWWERNQWLG
ncbi:uncharacterized protein LOC122653244 isoform X2 [Telopea speciosissima]|uniref:uncharacterized protein LOC122653244 isoform X2 n=1 Tax=Telopea speciosissima TaxID=54955 RepID=UPI001CC4B70D|nr:uncharacterized protein LOC122653244 isoform X2 [Telopea speciosissima]